VSHCSWITRSLNVRRQQRKEELGNASAWSITERWTIPPFDRPGPQIGEAIELGWYQICANRKAFAVNCRYTQDRLSRNTRQKKMAHIIHHQCRATTVMIWQRSPNMLNRNPIESKPSKIAWISGKSEQKDG
jgi:hypothetical protein